MTIHFIKYRNIYFNPLFWRLLIFIISIYFCGYNYNCDDDGLWFSNTENNGTMTTYGRSQNNEYGYQTHYSDGRPIYQAYNEEQNISERQEYQRRDSNGRPIYEAYNENLQSTSRGYRYEMNGDTTYTNVNQETFIVELDGKPVYAKYYSTDLNGNNLYSYSNDGSTMLGIIEPTKSEVINNGYYVGGPVWRSVDTSPTTLTRRLVNKVRIGVKNHIAKSSDESLRQHNLSTKKFMNDIKRVQNMSRSRETKRYIDRVSSMPTKQVRRFD